MEILAGASDYLGNQEADLTFNLFHLKEDEREFVQNVFIPV